MRSAKHFVSPIFQLFVKIKFDFSDDHMKTVKYLFFFSELNITLITLECIKTYFSH